VLQLTQLENCLREAMSKIDFSQNFEGKKTKKKNTTKKPPDHGALDARMN